MSSVIKLRGAHELENQVFYTIYDQTFRIAESYIFESKDSHRCASGEIFLTFSAWIYFSSSNSRTKTASLFPARLKTLSPFFFFSAFVGQINREHISAVDRLIAPCLQNGNLLKSHSPLPGERREECSE